MLPESSGMKNYTLTALLPMKGNSNRVKEKNFRQICGKPLYKWMLDTLLTIEVIDRIVINTDVKQKLIDDGLIESNRLIIRDRNPEICGDDVSMNLVIKDDIDSVESAVYIMTHTTNPLLSVKTIENAIRVFGKAMNDNKADSLFSVNKYQARFYDPDARPINHDPVKLVKTQDLEPYYEENSSLYLFTRKSFYRTNSRIGKKPLMFVTPKRESVDIDDQEDFDLAEILLGSSPGN
jgi:CMP-N-acetylneuraminic acid synthetase